MSKYLEISATDDERGHAEAVRLATVARDRAQEASERDTRLFRANVKGVRAAQEARAETIRAMSVTYAEGLKLLATREATAFHGAWTRRAEAQKIAGAAYEAALTRAASAQEQTLTAVQAELLRLSDENHQRGITAAASAYTETIEAASAAETASVGSLERLRDSAIANAQARFEAAVTRAQADWAASIEHEKATRAFAAARANGLRTLTAEQTESLLQAQQVYDETLRKVEGQLAPGTDGSSADLPQASTASEPAATDPPSPDKPAAKPGPPAAQPPPEPVKAAPAPGPGSERRLDVDEATRKDEAARNREQSQPEQDKREQRQPEQDKREQHPVGAGGQSPQSATHVPAGAAPTPNGVNYGTTIRLPAVSPGNGKKA